MRTSVTAPATEWDVGWSRIVLVTLALSFVARNTAEMLVSESTPFGWPAHWSKHENVGRLLGSLAHVP